MTGTGTPRLERKDVPYYEENVKEYADRDAASGDSARGSDLRGCLRVLALAGSFVALIDAVKGEGTEGAAAEETRYTRHDAC